MMPDINDIARRRKILGITQKDLSRITVTSQSLIAKLESGKINPSYNIAKSIFAALDSLEKRKEDEINAKNLYNKRVYSISEKDSVHTATKIMKKYGISQIPVLDNGTIIGSVTERHIVELMSRGKKDIEKTMIKDIMDEPFPTIQESTPLSSISSLLNHNSAVLVVSRGKILGIITKADLVKLVK